MRLIFSLELANKDILEARCSFPRDRIRLPKMIHDVFGSIVATAHSHIVPFRTSGAGSPLFCFPGSGGNVYEFREMVAALPEGQPVYAIDMEWLCEAEQDFSIEQLAAFYLDVIRKIQKNGPYYFCGYSFGGLVAYEMAMRLINEGDCARLVALLDVPNPASSDSARFLKTYLIDRLKKYCLHLVRGDIKAFIGSGLALVTSRARRFFMRSIKIGFRTVNRPLPGKLRVSDLGFTKAWQSYIPQRYPNSLVCFRVRGRGPEYDLDPSMGWDACAMGGVQVHVVPGGHLDMMRMPHVLSVADKLAAYLDGGPNQEKESVARSDPRSISSGT
jgi:thioesterase domain-containing protein